MSFFKKAFLFIIFFHVPIYSNAKIVAFEKNSFPSLYDFIEEIMKVGKVPGLSIAVVRGDEVLFVDGIGVRDLETRSPVTKDTVFPIASLTKSFTAVAIGTLVQDGKVNWDGKIIDYFPNFRVSDPYVTENATIRDALSHRTGIDRADDSWHLYPSKTRDEVIDLLHIVPQKLGFRAGYLYNNFLYTVMGEIPAKVMNQKWEAYIKEKLLTPLAMKHTSPYFSDLKKRDNYAEPYTLDSGMVIKNNFHDGTNTGPAGIMNSTASDMVQWCRFYLGNGKVDGVRIVDKEIVRELQSPQNIVGLSRGGPLKTGEKYNSYAMGLSRADYRGKHTLISHTGGIDGFSTKFSFLPEEKLCVVTFVNLSNALPVNMAVERYIFDNILGYDDTNWLELFKVFSNHKLEQDKIKSENFAKGRKENTQPTFVLSAYEGQFQNQLYGSLDVSSTRNHLQIRLGELQTGKLFHWHYDTYRVDWDIPGIDDSLLTFFVDNEGRLSSVELDESYGKILFQRIE